MPLFTTIMSVLGSEPVQKTASVILDGLAKAGDRRARLQAIETVSDILGFQNELILKLGEKLEEEGRESLTLSEACLLMIQANVFALKVINATADLDKKNEQ